MKVRDPKIYCCPICVRKKSFSSVVKLNAHLVRLHSAKIDQILEIKNGVVTKLASYLYKRN